MKNKCIYKYFLCIIFLLVSIIWIFIIIPGKKTIFPCYALFRATADHEVYLKQLPSSSKQVRYFVYDEPYLDKSGYCAVLSIEEYESAKTDLLAKYIPFESESVYYYQGGQHRKLDLADMQHKRVDFLDELLPATGDVSNYYILADMVSDESRKYVYEGVICNDETCEIIEFTYYHMFSF